MIYPAISVLYARWVPLRERSFLASFSLAANAVGIIFGNFLTGAAIHISAYWPTGFYLWAVLGVIWLGIFMLFAYSQPASHPYITEEELNMLSREIGMLYIIVFRHVRYLINLQTVVTVIFFIQRKIMYGVY